MRKNILKENIYMRRKVSKNIRKQKGITLIALIVTIIVLLILASVSIAMLTGENGILTKATTAKEKTVEAQDKEMVELAKYESEINKVVGNRENSLINYSTSEQVIGTWIDGKLLYQKTIQVGTVSSNLYQTGYLFDTEISNVSQMWIVNGLGVYQDGRVLPIPYSAPSSIGGRSISVEIINGNKLNFATQDWGVTDCIITVQYTKY